jgi:hypothetical protein
MAVANRNKLLLDRPMWEQLPFAPATGVAGTSIADDGVRYIYCMFATSATAAQFWRYDTWHDSWQQLASPATTTITVGKILYADEVGSQYSGKVFGSIYSFQANGTTCYWYRYDIATNTWASALSTTSVPAGFGTDAYLCFPCPARNNFEGGYHSGSLRTITTTSETATGVTSIAVSSLPAALASGTVLDFGKMSITLTTAASRGATTLAVSALSNGVLAGTAIKDPEGFDIWVVSTAAAGATSLSVQPIIRSLGSGAVCSVRIKAVLTAAASASATSITVSGLLVSIPSSANAYYYNNIYLIGNNATQMYRYSVNTNAWSTTSENSGTPALPALTAAAGAGCAIKWMPAYSGGTDKLWILRATGTSAVYIYDLVANTMSTQTYYPSTETFAAGTWVATRTINGKQSSLIIQKDATMRFFEGVPPSNRLETYCNQWLYPTGAAVIGDRATTITSPDGVEFLYVLLHSATSWLRCALIDQ